MKKTSRIITLFSIALSLSTFMIDTVPILNQESIIKADDIKSYDQSNCLLIDVARRHMSFNDIKNILENVDSSKFPFVQLHLGDNQGFAVKTEVLNNQGWLSNSDINQLCAIAKEKNITLVPDIDVPSHAGGIIKDLQNMNSPYLDKDVIIDNETLDYTNPDTIDLVNKIYKEVLNDFNRSTSTMMIGSDEVPGNVANAKDLSSFINNIDKTCHDLGFTNVLVWNDSMNENVLNSLNKDITIVNWNNDNQQDIQDDSFKTKDADYHYSNMNVSDMSDDWYSNYKANLWKQHDKNKNMLCLWSDGRGDGNVSNQQIIDFINKIQK